ncbi:MAG TPA: hypothetical protein VHS31_05530 [Tepidisphaeraceae bacterium]|jgi:hypothetical protein|nr:hypothetical protein [Tepidisphaeraceae bacterium]
MSRLDQHVAAVQNKLALSRFIEALAWAMLVFAALVTLDIIVARVFHVQFSHPKIWFWSAAGVAALAAMFWAMAKRPSREHAAVAIDEKLGLREKISTALYVRGSTDPFAVAAVKDAEATAGNVVLNYYKHFPIRMPRATYGLCAAIIIALGVGFWFPQMDLFGTKAKAEQVASVEVARTQATNAVKQALATVEAVPKSMSDDDAIKKAQIDLSNLLKKPIQDPAAANRSALKALEETREAVKRQAENNSKYAEAQNNMKDLSKNIAPPTDEKGPVADAQRKIADGKFTEAFNQLQQVAEKFDKMDDQQKQKATQQMQQMAKQLQQAAGNPQQQQQQIAKQLQQQLGVNQQQAQQMAKQMQQAAQGNQQAQQQLQQQAQQMMKQMNNGQGPTQAQQQQMQQAMQQMQAQANSSAAAGQMAQAAQQMAQAMQQASQGQGQQANGQQMAQGMGQMQQQLQNMEATAQDAAQIAAAQQAMNDAVENAAGNCNGQCNGQGQEGGTVKGHKDGASPWAAGNPNGKGGGMGKAGIGAGGQASKSPSPFAPKPEMDSSEDNQKGRILASNYIKDNHPIAGKSDEGLKKVAESAVQDASDEVDNDRISNQAKSTVEKYFKTMEEDAK